MKIKILLNKEDVVSKFGSQVAAADALGVSKVAVGLWDEFVPQRAAWAYVALYPELPHEIEKAEQQAA